MYKCRTRNTPHIRVVFTAPSSVYHITPPVGGVSLVDIAIDYRSPFEASHWLRCLNSRLVLFIDHHEVPPSVRLPSDGVFHIFPRDETPSCAPAVGHVVREYYEYAQDTRTLFAHYDFDGVMSAATFLLGGVEPYWGAFHDADIIDGMGSLRGLSDRGKIIYAAIYTAGRRGHEIRGAILRWLVDDSSRDEDFVQRVARQYRPVEQRTVEVADSTIIDEYGMAVIELGRDKKDFDPSMFSHIMYDRGAQFVVIGLIDKKGYPATLVSTVSGLHLADTFRQSGTQFLVHLRGRPIETVTRYLQGVIDTELNNLSDIAVRKTAIVEAV